ncbi:hypothetical protein CIG75_18830 [Tumebacillus algifaecis]|uniref:Uncharacterized protein n=1 Tax=Tumebacillus algifaecis TaxID=1214604 RepID=A0A223D5Q4_9BACL|nr:hypothetical protein [Tumebacillus algifaecis]ASS76793.1 hypothetical protein CIG75_18830 [Tumebacillus algifaecis]
MKTLRDTLNTVESKILPVNHVDHRFRLESISFDLDQIRLQARLLTSNEQDYTIQCRYSYNQRNFTRWQMIDHEENEFIVVGIVSKTLYYFAHRATVSIIEALGHEIA